MQFATSELSTRKKNKPAISAAAHALFEPELTEEDFQQRLETLIQQTQAELRQQKLKQQNDDVQQIEAELAQEGKNQMIAARVKAMAALLSDDTVEDDLREALLIKIFGGNLENPLLPQQAKPKPPGPNLS